MIKNLHFIFFVFPIAVFSQVGINQPSPVEQVHVGGSTSTIRIDGLNSPNNSLNIGTNGSSRVFADVDGDLVLGSAANNIEILFNPFNYLDDPEDSGGANSNVITQTGTGTGFQAAGYPRQIGPGLSNFTLTKKAIVEINYSLSWKIVKNNTSNIDDGAARIFQTLMYLIKLDAPGAGLVTVDADGAPLILGYALGLNGQFYNNEIGTNGANDQYFNTGTDYVKLPPGTYQPMFAAQIAVSITGGTGAVKAFVGGGQDEVQIVAHYYN